MRKNELKICFASSSGGHFEQLLMLKPLMKEYNAFIVTEHLDYDIKIDDIPVYYVLPNNRTDTFFALKFLVNLFKSLCIIASERPDMVVSTGALAAIPVMLWVKVFGGKVIYIESFAKIETPNLSGKVAYRIADQFYIQWESLRKFFPNAINKGGIY